MKTVNGFTLTEAMIALAIVGVLAAVVLPAIRGTVSAARSAGERSALTEALLVALNQSTINSANVVLCASTDGSSCNGGVDWTGGWISFLDRNGDRIRDPGDTLLRTHPRLASGIRLRSSTGRTHIVFQPQGGATAGSNVTFTLCDNRGAAKASTIVMANSGRMRFDAATPAQALACLGM